MARERWVNYGLFFLGVFLVAGGIVVGFGALQYEFSHVSTSEAAPSVAERPLEYETLTPEEQRVVDGAISGKQYEFDRNGPLPGYPHSSFTAQKIAVQKGETYHVFTHKIAFDETGPRGLLAIVLVLSGPVAVIESIRRHHFPQVGYPWQAS